MMTNFAHYACGSWREGQLPNITPIYIVSYDQANTAYQVPRRHYDAFVDWVAQAWESSDDFIGEDETSAEYLERRHIHIREDTWS